MTLPASASERSHGARKRESNEIETGKENVAKSGRASGLDNTNPEALICVLWPCLRRNFANYQKILKKYQKKSLQSP